MWGAFPRVLGERLNGIQEVRGSIPLISTRKKYLRNGRYFFVAVFLEMIWGGAGAVQSDSPVDCHGHE